MPTSLRTTTEWDYKSKDYILVRDPKIEKYISICSGTYLFDLSYQDDRIQLNSVMPDMSPKGMIFNKSSVTLELEDIPEIISTLIQILDLKGLLKN